jgi:hypothetical protein
MRDLMRMVGPAANGMILSSRQRLLVRLRTGDPRYVRGALVHIRRGG